MQSFRETEVLWKSESCCFVDLKNPFYSYLHAFLNKNFVKKCRQFAYLSYLTHFHILLQRDIKDHTSRLQCTLCFCSSTSAHMHTVWFFYNCVGFFFSVCMFMCTPTMFACLCMFLACEQQMSLGPKITLSLSWGEAGAHSTGLMDHAGRDLKCVCLWERVLERKTLCM